MQKNSDISQVSVDSVLKSIFDKKIELSPRPPQKFFDTQDVLEYVGYAQMRQLYSKHFNSIGDDWSARTSEQVQHFLQDLLGTVALEVVSVQNYTRKDGWPGWVYGYRIID